jgi:hypothetical protein
VWHNKYAKTWDTLYFRVIFGRQHIRRVGVLCGWHVPSDISRRERASGVNTAGFTTSGPSAVGRPCQVAQSEVRVARRPSVLTIQPPLFSKHTCEQRVLLLGTKTSACLLRSKLCPSFRRRDPKINKADEKPPKSPQPYHNTRFRAQHSPVAGGGRGSSSHFHFLARVRCAKLHCAHKNNAA